MDNEKFRELPIRAREEMAQDIAKIIQNLHRGKPELATPLIQNLKARSLHLSEQIQQDVLIFAEQVQFQYAYDPWHKVTEDVRQAADRLLDDLGLHAS